MTLESKIQMVDLHGQYTKIKPEIDSAIEKVINQTGFINGQEVKDFAQQLSNYTGAQHSITCGNGTDALQVAIMALHLPKGSEIIVPAFTFVATAEVVAFLGYQPVFADVEIDSFNISISSIQEKITPNTSAIIPVHLFGQCANMEAIIDIASKHNLTIIEDSAQAIGSYFIFKNGLKKQAGVIGNVGTTSFFPSKNLGCMGDGGAVFTNDKKIADTIQVICNHGQREKYQYDEIGINSRLDTIQAAILKVKLNYLNDYITARQKSAAFYDNAFASLDQIEKPKRSTFSTHVFHQYTLKVKGGKRDQLKTHLGEHGIPSMIYYPKPLHLHKAYSYLGYQKGDLPVSEQLSEEVLSLPMHTELEEKQLDFICSKVIEGLV